MVPTLIASTPRKLLGHSSLWIRTGLVRSSWNATVEQTTPWSRVRVPQKPGLVPKTVPQPIHYTTQTDRTSNKYRDPAISHLNSIKIMARESSTKCHNIPMAASLASKCQALSNLSHPQIQIPTTELFRSNTRLTISYPREALKTQLQRKTAMMASRIDETSRT